MDNDIKPRKPVITIKRPKLNQEFWYIDKFWMWERTIWTGCMSDRALLIVGNVFTKKNSAIEAGNSIQSMLVEFHQPKKKIT